MECVLTLFKPGFFVASCDWGEGWIPPPPENNVTVELGHWKLVHICTCQKTTPVPNLVAIALNFNTFIKTLINTKYKCQKKVKVELENSM